MNDLVIYAIVIGASALLTFAIRRYALVNGLLDNPNQRSSHAVPTPRGGGLAIVLAFTALLVYLLAGAGTTKEILYAITIGGVLISAVGFVDDHRDVPAAIRFTIHALAAIIAVWLIEPQLPMQFGKTVISSGIAGEMLAVIATVWFVNLFNFMDGIDGIAGAEAVFICLAAAAIAGTNEFSAADLVAQFQPLFLGLGAACVGFLLWNWPPAKIFMGDVGSGFVGFVIAVLAVASVAYAVLPIWTWLILTGVFFVDASYTLFTRIFAGVRWFEAHRSHAYQRAARQAGSHRQITIAVTAVNVAWLLPLAWYAAIRPDRGVMLWAIAWTPLIVACRVIGAGRSDEE